MKTLLYVQYENINAELYQDILNLFIVRLSCTGVKFKGIFVNFTNVIETINCNYNSMYINVLKGCHSSLTL